MDDDQQSLIEEEEEELDQDNTSNVFSLLKNIKQPLVIDEEAANQSELSPDAYALSEVIKELLPLFSGSCELYSDLRQRFVERKLSQTNLSFHSETVADFEPEASPSMFANNDKLKEALIKVARQLRQFKNENANAKYQHEQAIKQLQNENNNLREELSNLRKSQFESPSFSSPERASSSQVTFQSMVITPKTTKTDQYYQSSQSPQTPSRLSASGSANASPRLTNSSTLSQRSNGSSPLSQRSNNTSPLSQRSNNTSPLSQRSNNTSPLSQRPTNSSTFSQRSNNTSPLSQRPTNSSTLSQRSNHSSKTNNSSSSSNLK